MRSILLRTTTLTLLLASAVAAHAGNTVLYTAPTFMPGSGHLMFCYASNLDARERELTVEIIDVAGTVIAASSGLRPPGTSVGASTNNLFASYCRITYVGNRKSVRGAMTLGLNGVPYVPQVTLEAR